MAYPSDLDLALANDALARLAERTIGAFGENSPAARAISRIYPRVRSLMFAAGDWRFATAYVSLGSPVAGPFPWGWEYPLPSGVARARIVVAQTPSADGVTLEPVPFEEGIGSRGRVIRTDINPATLVYTQEVVDPSLWDVGFASAFTVQLAAEIALPITGNGNLATAMRQQAALAIQAQMPMGQAQSVTQAQRGPSTTTMARGGH